MYEICKFDVYVYNFDIVLKMYNFDAALQEMLCTVQGEVDELQQLAPDISERLVVRPEDLPESVEQDMRYYRDYMLKPLEVRE